MSTPEERLATDPDLIASQSPNRDQLIGFRIGVTSDRRSEELIAAFERRGAAVLHAPVIRIAPNEQDARLMLDTRRMIDARPDVVLVTTAYGVRRWMQVAETEGLAEELIGALRGARILVRGPKARGGVRGLGLTDSGISARETTASMVDRVLSEDPAGLTIVVQLHGAEDAVQLDRLTAAGATVLTVAPYRWVLPDDDDGRAIELVEAICGEKIDAVTFTSAPAVEALLAVAEQRGLRDPLVRAFRRAVVASAVGPVTAAPLEEAGIEPLVPERFRMGTQIKQLAEHLETSHIRLATRAGLIKMRSGAVTIDGVPLHLTPACSTVFRALVRADGGVVSRAALAEISNAAVHLDARSSAPDRGAHAVEAVVNRLRNALPDRGLVATVVKRGYRLDV
jgi:uroporphyrinogen-III synthase